jgi:DNA-damage-inducible protein D
MIMSQPKRVSPFEAIRHEDDNGEYWSARELAQTLEYASWQRFIDVIKRAMVSCETSGQEVSDHFNETVKMIQIGKGGKRKTTDYHLSRYACYLVVQNGDPAKRLVALGQAYFAVQTRRAEILQEIGDKSEAEQRIILRDQLAAEHGLLAEVVTEAGIVTQEDFAEFYDHGWLGLYDMRYRELQRHRGLKKGETPLDYMGPEESVLKLMHGQQSRAKIERDQPKSPQQAGQIYYQVGRVFRRALEEIGAPMPEELPKAEHIDLVRRAEARRLKDELRRQRIEEEDRLGLWALLAEEPSDRED